MRKHLTLQNKELTNIIIVKMNTNPVNKFVNTRYRKLMTVTDIDMLFHKKKNNHIRIVECKKTKEGKKVIDPCNLDSLKLTFLSFKVS